MAFDIFEDEDFITAERVQALCDGQDVIFCSVGNLDTVFQRVLKECVVVCTGTDGCILPTGVIKKHVNAMANMSFQLDYHIDSDFKVPACVKGIFSANVDVRHEKIFPMPRGLENFSQLTYMKKKEGLLKAIELNPSKEKLLYMNHNVNTNKADRERPYQLFRTNDWCTVESGENGSGFDKYLHQLNTHKFVISPDGNSLEGHRTWEALYVGTIPIVQRHVFTEDFSQNIPMLIIDSWEEVTEEFLNNKYEEIMSNKANWNFDLIRIGYWKKKIENVLYGY